MYSDISKQLFGMDADRSQSSDARGRDDENSKWHGSKAKAYLKSFLSAIKTLTILN